MTTMGWDSKIHFYYTTFIRWGQRATHESSKAMALLISLWVKGLKLRPKEKMSIVP